MLPESFSQFSQNLFGFLPLAIGTGEGAEVRAPMAITVIGGLNSTVKRRPIASPLPQFCRANDSLTTATSG